MIDLRSDTVTQPCEAMRAVMASAPVGDDVYGEDPTVNELEQFAAKLTNKESALFAPSGTQSNLLALMAHCERGDEYIVGQQAHTYKYEGGGAAVLGSIQPQPLPFNEDATFNLNDVEHAIKPIDSHFARTRLICLENTHHGICLPQGYSAQVKGARLMNAAVKQNQTLADLCQPFDSVSLCLSKGLGAPIGSVLVGSTELIAKARRWRKVVGGGMRQAGIIAAAGLFALKHNMARLADDHRRAKLVNEAIKEAGIVTTLAHSAETNMIFISLSKAQQVLLKNSQQQFNIIADINPITRLVFHKDINDEHLNNIVEWLNQSS